MTKDGWNLSSCLLVTVQNSAPVSLYTRVSRTTIYNMYICTYSYTQAVTPRWAPFPVNLLSSSALWCPCQLAFSPYHKHPFTTPFSFSERQDWGTLDSTAPVVWIWEWERNGKKTNDSDSYRNMSSLSKLKYTWLSCEFCIHIDLIDFIG